MLVLPFLHSDVLLFLYAKLFGFSHGGDVPQIPSLIAHCFGLTSIATILGLVTTLTSLGAAFGPTIAGYVFDVSGSYNNVFLGLSASLFISVLLILQLKRVSP